MDCDDFYNIDIAKTIDFIKQETVFKNGCTVNKSTGKRITAIIPVHVYGNAVNMEELLAVCCERNIAIVEDAAESIGTYYTKGRLKDRHTGTIGDVGCYSFNGNKIITTGGGGMLVTNNENLAAKAKYLTTQGKDDAVRYVHDEVAYNYRLTNVLAALGVAQLEQLPEYIENKRRNYMFYRREIDSIPGLHLAEVPAYASSNYWYYCLQIDERKYGMGREKLMAHLSEQGIQTRPIWQLNHLQKPYRYCQHYKIDKARNMLAKTLNIPCSVNISRSELEHVITMLEDGHTQIRR
jgi:dTDP-4-amino-4,6-dideoxygalactose transaminase